MPFALDKIVSMKNFIFLLFMTSILVSCRSTGFLMAKAKVTMFEEPYPQKDIDAKIDVYKTKEPKKEYIEIAEISCGDTDQAWSLKQIKIKAREIGADGLILLGKSGNYGIGTYDGNLAYGAASGYGIKAIAIKYQE